MTKTPPTSIDANDLADLDEAVVRFVYVVRLATRHVGEYWGRPFVFDCFATISLARREFHGELTRFRMRLQ